MIFAINTHFMNSFISNEAMFDTEAPMTFLMPISFVRCSAIKEAKPNKPRHAMNTASIVKLFMSLRVLTMFL